MKSIKYFETYSDYENAMVDLQYPTVALISETDSVKVIDKPENYILAYYNVTTIDEETTLMYRTDSVKSMSINGNSIDISESYQFTQTGLKVVRIDLNEYLDDYASLFEDCDSLVNVDLTHINWHWAVDVSCMFKNCVNLTQIALTFNSKRLIHMTSMCEGCISLTKVDFTDVNAPNLTHMDAIFKSCSQLSEINITNINTPELQFVQSLCENCSQLTMVDFTSWKCSKIANCQSMFKNTNVENVMLGWDLNNVQNTNMDNFIVSPMCFGLTMRGIAPNVTSYNGWQLNTDGGELLYPAISATEYQKLIEYITTITNGMWAITPETLR